MSPSKQEKSKTFCCIRGTSEPLTLVAFLPKTGFTKTELIPITVEIDNPSNVKIKSVEAALLRKIHWKGQGGTQTNKVLIKKIGFGDVPENSSKTWSENMWLDGVPFPNIKNCNLITMDHKLEVRAIPHGMHLDLKLKIPLTIGDIPYQNEKNGGFTAPA